MASNQAMENLQILRNRLTLKMDVYLEYQKMSKEAQAHHADRIKALSSEIETIHTQITQLETSIKARTPV